MITGVESSDVMAAQVGISIAEMLGLPFAYAVTEVQPGERKETIHITKELGSGKKQFEEIESAGPDVLSDRHRTAEFGLGTKDDDGPA